MARQPSPSAPGVVREIEPWQELLDAGREDQRLVREAHEHERPPVLGDIPPLHPRLVEALGAMGISSLYSHQVDAVHAAMAGDFIVTTGTASGKSMCFNLPTLSHLLQEPSARALYVYPTKALAQDQARALHAFGLHKQVRPAIYDGDTPREARAAIRRRANVVLTNPDMLHVGILPNHRAWSEFLHRLDVVVVDEAHVYRGVFGSHVGNVLRRLRRMAPDARFFMASATIANPVELAERLTGVEDFTLVDRDGSPRARRRIAVWNPPLIDEDLGSRRSALGEAADILADLVRGGARTICFIKSRKAVELTTKLVQDKLGDELGARIAPYRAGYTPQQRREIEGRLVSGELLAVITTDALELGIDIGALDAAVVVTFPGTMASLKQMWGRAGRRGRGLAVYVAGEDALDQFLCREPDQLLERPVEAAILDYESEQIHLAHLLCAAHEAPLSEADAPALGPRWQLHAEALEARGELRRLRGKFVLAAPEDYPAARVSLRSASPDSFAVVDVSSGELLGTVETARAFSTVHDGAVYLHLGRSYEVVELDLESRRALVKPFDGNWYTQPKKETDTWIEQLLDQREVLGCRLSFGRVSVAETVLAYQRKRLQDHEVIDLQMLDLPTTEFSTQALWYELPDSMTTVDFPREILLGALHAAEHAQIAVLPLLAMCDRWDIGGLSTAGHQQTGGPTIFIYDGHPGGVGITRQAYLRFEELVTDAASLIRDCPCESGCPSCVQSPKCGNLNEPLSKRGSLELMVRMLRR
ncbi:MAG TPA: DEAD/DEAH box helicase [Solirubrobacteraceae bacterium]|nr:DEAD/DEAH box helicase [Solirubrobacteraceae bacterium]